MKTIMKNPFSKMRGLGLLKHRHAIAPSFVQLDELFQASKDMKDMRDFYDRLLSAAAGTMNTAYEFSESLQKMGDCLENVTLSDDEDSGRVLLMLGKVQFHIQKLIDNYRSNINLTITAPSESFLNELHVVEDMKRKCDEKRSTYEALKIKHDKGWLKNIKVSSHQMQSAREEFDGDATLFISRINSLKRGQFRSLLTQAARHNAAQMAFFRKALKSLEAIELHVKSTTEKQHIDYCFTGLEDDKYEDNSSELDFDSHMNEVSFGKNMNGIYLNTGSKSAPLSGEYQHMRQLSTRKLNTYVLPPPIDKTSVTSGNASQHSQPRLATYNMWQSMPLEPNKYGKKPMVSASGPIPTLSTSELLLPKIRQLHQLPRPPGRLEPRNHQDSASQPPW